MARKQARRGRSNSSTTQGPIRILHLSDLHLCPECKWDSEPIFTGLTEIIAGLPDSRLAPDVVAITGDIANEGRREDYQEARRWIDKRLRPALPPRFPNKRMLIVPGNHDVDRSKVNAGTRSFQSGLLANPDQDAIAEVLQDPDQRGVLLKRHHAYVEFANSLRGAKDQLGVPWWSTTLELHERKVHFAGLCSSWTSCSKEEYGKLLVGRWQVNQLLQEAKNADWSVALIHHPWEFLTLFDRNKAKAAVRRGCDVVLCGHLHAQESCAMQYPNDVCLELAAGAVYVGGGHPKAFQLVELEPDAKTVRVHFWLWRDGRWIPDRNAYPEAADGVATFHLESAGAGAKRAAPPAPSVDATKYLRSLQARTAYIDIRGLQVGSGRANRFPIHELYIPLTTADVPVTRRGKKSAKDEPMELVGRGESRIELHEALKHRHLVIVGDPGAGKTTFLRRIANLLCQSRLGEEPEGAQTLLGLDETPFPILIRLAELGDHIAASRAQHAGPTIGDSPAWLPHFLATASEDSAAGLDEAFFREQLEGGSVLVLLDGLDEASSEQQRKQLIDLVEKASREAYTNCRFVLTSRPTAYKGDTVLPEFTQVRIDALEDEAIETFLTHWCSTLFPESAAEAQRHLNELLEALRGRVEIRRLARNPVMLTALAVVHWNEKRLPEQRADLYGSVISWLARSRETKAGRPTPELCVALHQELALAMQDHSDGRQVQVPRYWAATQIAGELRDTPEDRRVREAEAFLDQEELDSGIVVRRGDHVRFWHLTFQEYLAAKALASRSEDAQRERLFSRPEKLYRAEWKEVVLLLAGVLYHQGVRRVDAMFSAILDGLGDAASLADQARCFGLLGAGVQDLSPVNYRPGDPRYQKMAQEVMAIFDAERSRSVAIEVAIEAAEALGAAGDPRFVPRSLEHNWVTIPAGEFLMGAQKKHPSKPNYDQAAYGWEAPVHKVHLDAYCIGRYPVTVCEYQRFVDDGGYANEALWRGGGFGEWKQPYEWDEQLAHPNRPMIYVRWYEAKAYAAWVGCRLPTEAEWERAARGAEGRRYPWGDDDPNPAIANFGRNVRHATPVGVYPRGGTPEGIMDMVGNVWEWCEDCWHGSYVGAPADGRAWTTGRDPSARVLRGGSWNDGLNHCRSANCFWLGPANRRDGLGFRVAAGA